MFPSRRSVWRQLVQQSAMALQLLSSSLLAGASSAPPPLCDAATANGFCATEYRSVFEGSRAPRGIAVTADGQVLGLERGSETGSVVLYHDFDEDGAAERITTLATAPGLNHGLAVHGGFVYASSDTTVFRWQWSGGDAAFGHRQTVVSNINADGQGGAPRGHWTRTLVFDATGRLYVSVGSLGNVDDSSYRARIRRFELPLDDALPSAGIDFADGEVFADGLRNEVGLAFDAYGVLWGVENGADNLERADLGGDIHNDNPAEELNRFPEARAGDHWGYPFCWSEFELDGAGAGRGSVWAWPTFLDDGTHTDAWCRANTIPPELSMQAHSAPLGITFYNHTAAATRADCGNGRFPQEMDGDAFIAFHGYAQNYTTTNIGIRSWNRDVPTGYKVVRVAMDGSTGLPRTDMDQPVDLMWHRGSSAMWPSGLRPVDVKFDACGRLLVSSDGTGVGHGQPNSGRKIVVIRWNSSNTSCPTCTAPPFKTSSATHPLPESRCGLAIIMLSSPLLVLTKWAVG